MFRNHDIQICEHLNEMLQIRQMLFAPRFLPALVSHMFFFMISLQLKKLICNLNFEMEIKII